MASGPADDKVQLFIGTAKIRAGQIIKKKQARARNAFASTSFPQQGEKAREMEKRAANELDLKRMCTKRKDLEILNIYLSA